MSTSLYGIIMVFVIGQRSFEFDVNTERGKTDDLPLLHDCIQNGRIAILKFNKLNEC